MQGLVDKLPQDDSTHLGSQGSRMDAFAQALEYKRQGRLPEALAVFQNLNEKFSEYAFSRLVVNSPYSRHPSSSGIPE